MEAIQTQPSRLQRMWRKKVFRVVPMPVAAGVGVLALAGGAAAAWVALAQGSSVNSITIGTAPAPRTVSVSVVSTGPGPTPGTTTKLIVGVHNNSGAAVLVNSVALTVVGDEAKTGKTNVAACPLTNFAVKSTPDFTIAGTQTVVPFVLVSGGVANSATANNTQAATLTLASGAPEACAGNLVQIQATVNPA